MRVVLAASLVGALGCAQSPDHFRCQESTECTSSAGMGVCEATGACSFSDSVCPSGRRYGELSGGLSGQCVVEGLVDAGEELGDGDIDAAGADATPADAALPCDIGFVFSPTPPGTGSINNGAYSNDVPFVNIGMEFSGPGTVTKGPLDVQGGPPYTWSYDFVADAGGLYEVTFSKDNGQAVATCSIVIADTGSPPSL